MKKLNNKGFSLIELIIVMAIMAILTVAIAPQYLKYVERSRKSTDVQTVATLITAIDIYAADPTSTAAIVDGSKLILNTTDTTVSSTNATGNLDKALENAGIKSMVLKSSKWVSSGNVEITIDVDTATGAISYTDNCTEGSLVKGITVSGS